MKNILKIFVLLLIFVSNGDISASETLKDKMKKAQETVGTLKQKAADVHLDFPDISMEGVLEASASKLTEYSIQLAEIMPILEELGFRVSTFRMEVVPPMGKLRIVSRDTDKNVSLEEMTKLISAYKPAFQRLILVSAVTAKNIQKKMELQIAVMDIEIGTSPDVKFSYIKDINNKEDIEAIKLADADLLCGNYR